MMAGSGSCIRWLYGRLSSVKALAGRWCAILEQQVKSRGGLTIQLGTDDQNNLTSLGGVDLYPDPLVHLRQIRNLHGHPFEFYQKLGFVLVGLVPDANGFGKPDILIAKRVA